MKLKIFKNKLAAVILLALLTGGFLSLLFSAGLFEGWQLKISDNLFAEKKPLNNIVIIAIDDASLQEIGRYTETAFM